MLNDADKAPRKKDGRHYSVSLVDAPVDVSDHVSASKGVRRNLQEHISISDHVNRTVSKIRHNISWYAFFVLLVLSVLDGLIVVMTDQFLLLPTYTFLSFVIYIAGHFTIQRTITRETEYDYLVKNEHDTNINKLGMAFFILLIAMQSYSVCIFEVVCLVNHVFIALIIIIASYYIYMKIKSTDTK